MHAIVFSAEAEKVRAFFADVLGMPSADAGGGWLIFALPPAELAVHPADGETRHELYLTSPGTRFPLAPDQPHTGSASHRIAAHREIDRIGDEAQVMRPLVQLGSARDHSGQLPLALPGR
jgi:hypothetical protein